MTGGNAESLRKQLGYDFKDPGKLERALTHPSREGEENYQRLEFIGDRVLALVVSDLLCARYPTASEGDLAAWLNKLVCRETLAAVARERGIAPHIRLSESEEGAGGREKDSILADCCEAVIGAVYLDGGIEPAWDFIKRAWGERIVTAPEGMKDAKSALQEFVQAQGLATPEYAEIKREGPDHEPSFTMEVRIGDEYRTRGKGASKQAAEQAAAQNLLSELRIGGRQ